jgi:phosphoribosylformylglycinamidine synthase PurS subunit
MKARVHVFFKDSVFDPQGNTLAGSLKRLGFNSVKDVRVGKAIDVSFEDSPKDQVMRDLDKMCEQLLANPIIESYKYEILEPKK